MSAGSPDFKRGRWPLRLLSMGAIAFVTATSPGVQAFTYNIGAFWQDTVPPPVLAGFTAVIGGSLGQITVTVDFPTSPSLDDYAIVTVRKLAGATAPNANCSSDGTVIKTYNTPTFPDPDVITDTGTSGSYYSYRACIYDRANNLTSSQTQANVQAKPGAYYTGITYLGDNGSNYASCQQPTEATMNNEVVAQQARYGSLDGTNDWIRADLGSVKPINRIRVGGHGPNGGGCWVTEPSGYWNGGNVFLQFSNDASFTDMTGSNINVSALLTYSDTTMQNINFTTVNARYLRLFRASGWFGTGQFRIGEF